MNAIVPAAQAQNSSQPRGLAPSGMFSNPTNFEFAQRIAKVFSESQLIPAHLKGKVADCMIALHMAERLNDDPLTTMQNIMVINGRPGWMTSYMIARANRSGVFKGRISWRSAGTGEGLAVTAYATLADTGEEITAEVSMIMAKAEGWTKNAKYQSMPEHMLRFRSAAMLIRLYCSDVMLGMHTVEEVEDTSAPRDITPPRASHSISKSPPLASIDDAPPRASNVIAQQSAQGPQPDEIDWQREVEGYDNALSSCEAIEEFTEAVAMNGSVFADAPQAIKEQVATLEASMRASIERASA